MRGRLFEAVSTYVLRRTVSKIVRLTAEQIGARQSPSHNYFRVAAGLLWPPVRVVRGEQTGYDGLTRIDARTDDLNKDLA